MASSSTDDETTTNSNSCSICLENIVSPCHTNACSHEFCFSCLVEWSKRKAECPLCKIRFERIFHNIRSETNYDEIKVPTPTEPEGEDLELLIRLENLTAFNRGERWLKYICKVYLALLCQLILTSLIIFACMSLDVIKKYCSDSQTRRFWLCFIIIVLPSLLTRSYTDIYSDWLNYCKLFAYPTLAGLSMGIWFSNEPMNEVLLPPIITGLICLILTIFSCQRRFVLEKISLTNPIVILISTLLTLAFLHTINDFLTELLSTPFYNYLVNFIFLFFHVYCGIISASFFVNQTQDLLRQNRSNISWLCTTQYINEALFLYIIFAIMSIIIYLLTTSPATKFIIIQIYLTYLFYYILLKIFGFH